MTNALKTAAILAFPTQPTLTSPNKDGAHPHLYKKAYDAFNNAKARCTNPKNPSFPGYGGKGIKFLYGSITQFVDEVGLPPNKSVSLDRINPNGHYEPGNCRWASKAVQALNKGGAKLATNLSLADLVAQYDVQQLTAKQREITTEAWEHCIRIINRASMRKSEHAWLLEHRPDWKFSDSGWKPGQFRDFKDPESYFYLPSLTLLGERARIRGGPFGPAPSPYNLGTIWALGYLRPIDFVPMKLLEWYRDDFKNPDKGGAAWVGQSFPFLLAAGGIEGWMLALASTSARTRKSALYPVLSAVEALTELGGTYSWASASAPILDVRVLFIPDLEIDGGHATALKPAQASRLASLIEHRAGCGLKTFVGVANIHKLHESLRAVIIKHLTVRELSKIPPPQPVKLSKSTGPMWWEGNPSPDDWPYG